MRRTSDVRAMEHTEKRRRVVAQRVFSAMRLDPFFYRSVADQTSLTWEAVAVAVASALIMGLGLMLIRIVAPLWWLIGGLAWATGVLGLGTWYVTAVGRRMGGQGDYDQILRGLGYAMAPQALGFIPIADFLPGFLVGGVWATACAVVAIQEIHRVPTRVAVILVVAPVLMVIAVFPLVAIAIPT